MNLKIH